VSFKLSPFNLNYVMGSYFCDRKALGTKDFEGKAQPEEPHANTKKKLYDILYSLHLSLLTSKTHGPSFGSLHAVSFMHDQFVRPHHTQEFFTELSGICAKPSKVVCKWLPGGHVWAMLTRQRSQTEAIVAAVEALQQNSN
jgi:hypothetical protein